MRHFVPRLRMRQRFDFAVFAVCFCRLHENMIGKTGTTCSAVLERIAILRSRINFLENVKTIGQSNLKHILDIVNYVFCLLLFVVESRSICHLPGGISRMRRQHERHASRTCECLSLNVVRAYRMLISFAGSVD